MKLKPEKHIQAERDSNPRFSLNIALVVYITAMINHVFIQIFSLDVMH